MVTIRLQGGLGNQLFQYAMGRALALRHTSHQGKVLLDVSAFSRFRIWGGASRSFALEPFAVQGTIPPSKLLRTLRKNRFREKSFSFDSSALQIAHDVYVEGYWQSEKYFSDFSRAIKQDLSLKQGLGIPARRQEALIQKGESVSMHVRRGDYASNRKTRRFHGLCSLEYYTSAYALLQKELRDPALFVFSDDVRWTSKHILPLFPRAVMVSGAAHSDAEELTLMSLCKHHIIANSSFSWWGAWLSSYPGKKIIAPRKWFSSDLDTSDLIPVTWRQI